MNGRRLLSAPFEDQGRNSTFFCSSNLFRCFANFGRFLFFPTFSCSDSDASSADSEVSTASSTVKRVDVEKEKNGAPPGQVSSLLHPTWFILVSVTMLISSWVYLNLLNGQDVEGEDTMANLTTTFAGIFGKANLKWTTEDQTLPFRIISLSNCLFHLKTWWLVKTCGWLHST